MSKYSTVTDLELARRRRRRMVVVSGFGDDLMTPRGQRTQHLIKALGENWDVELIAMPSQGHRGGGGTTGRSIARRLASQGVRHTLYDRWEPWARRRLTRWHPTRTRPS